MLLERLTLVALFITVALAGCSDGTAPAVGSIGNQAEEPDTVDRGSVLRGPDDDVARGMAPLILPRGVRFIVLQDGPETPPKSRRR